MTRTYDIVGRAVVVTGGARGIGRAIVERLARAGAKVAVGDLDGALAATTAASVARQTGALVVSAPLDVADPDSWAAFLDAVARSARSTCSSTTPGSCRSVRCSRRATR